MTNGKLQLYANEVGDSCSFCHRLAHYQDDVDTYCGPCANQQFGVDVVRAVRSGIDEVKPDEKV